MATPKKDAVQPEGQSEYLLYDSTLEKHHLGSNIFSASIPKTTQKLLATAIQSVKGFGFSWYCLRVYYKPTGYNSLTRDTIRIEFAVLGSPASGKVADEVQSSAELLQVDSSLAPIQ